MGEERDNRYVEFRSNEFRTGYVVKSFDWNAYYGGMLAVYLFHSLLTGGDGRGIEHFGRAVISQSAYFPRTDLPRPSGILTENRPGWMQRRAEKEPRPTAAHLASHTIRLYVWLMLGGFLEGEEPDQAIASEVSKWSEQVGKRFGVRLDEIRDRFFIRSDEDTLGDSDVEIDVTAFENVAKSYLRPA